MTQVICTVCGSAGGTRRVVRGSILIEIILWLCFIIPGLLYSLWRHTTTHNVCRSCGSHDIVPVRSPMGVRLANEFGTELWRDPISGAEQFGRSIGKLVSKKKAGQ